MYPFHIQCDSYRLLSESSPKRGGSKVKMQEVYVVARYMHQRLADKHSLDHASQTCFKALIFKLDRFRPADVLTTNL